MKRVKAKDPLALQEMGGKYFDEGDYDVAFKYNKMAAELGNVEAHALLGISYLEGLGVEKDEIKALYYWEEAAIQGIPRLDIILLFMSGIMIEMIEL